MTEPRFDIDPDIRKAQTLPAPVYADPSIFQALKRNVFARSWQIAADLESVRVPGQVVPVTLLDGLLDEPLLFTRDGDDRLHCLSNVCTHRGTVLVEGACNEKSLRCRYHGRRFGLDGTFQYMPEFDQAVGFPSPADNLPAIPFGAWGPMLFASLDPEMPLEKTLEPVTHRIGSLPVDALRPDPARSRDYLVRANWALYCDNYLEGFHIPFVHAALNAAIDQSTYTTELFERASLQLALARPGEDCFDLPASSPDHGRRVAAYYFWIFPNTMLNFYPWGLSANIVKPLSPDLSRVSYLTWIWDVSRLDRGAGSGLDRVEREDEAVVEAVQRGIRSASYVRGRYSPTRETGVHHFHRLLAARL
jgi:choline monooxygenase